MHKDAHLQFSSRRGRRGCAERVQQDGVRSLRRHFQRRFKIYERRRRRRIDDRPRFVIIRSSRNGGGGHRGDMNRSRLRR